MNSKLLLCTSLFLILTLLIFSQQIPKKEINGTIKNIKYYQNKITIELRENQTKLTIFDSKILNLKKEDKIKALGKIEIWKNQKQFIVDKIIKLI